MINSTAAMKGTQSKGTMGSKASIPQSRSNPADANLALRLGLPIGLAMLAAALNVMTVRRQITPVAAYAFTQDLPIGTLLKAEHLRVVEVAGSIDLQVLLLPGDLAQGADANGLTLKEQLEQSPRIVSRAAVCGELVCKGALGGRATAQPGRNEEIISVPTKMISGGESLQPGQIVYFLAMKRGYTDASDKPIEIGPFRVALRENKELAESSRQDSIPLTYALDQEGKPTAAANILREAVVIDNSYTLAIVEKASRSSFDGDIAKR